MHLYNQMSTVEKQEIDWRGGERGSYEKTDFSKIYF